LDVLRCTLLDPVVHLGNTGKRCAASGGEEKRGGRISNAGPFDDAAGKSRRRYQMRDIRLRAGPRDPPHAAAEIQFRPFRPSSSDCRVPVRMRIWMTEPKGTAYPLQLVKAPPPPHQPEPDRALSESGGFIPVAGEVSRIPRATAHLKKAFSRGPRPRRQTAEL
jgi:hypothetical protein